MADTDPYAAVLPNADPNGDNTHAPPPFQGPSAYDEILPKAPPPPAPSLTGTSWSSLSEIPHKLALGTRNVIEGATSLPAALLDLGTWPGRAVQRAAGIPTTAPSDILNKTLDLTGLPQPQTPGEKVSAEAIRGGAAMLPTLGIGAIPELASAVPSLVRPLVATPGATSLPQATGQVAAGAAGGAAGEGAADLVPDWLKPTARLVGNIAGAGTTTGLVGALGTLKNAIGGVPSEIGAALDRLGIKPRTMGAVTDSPTARTAEATYTRLPISSGILQPQQQQMVDDFGRAVENTAAKVDPTSGARTVTAQDAGKIVQDRLQDWRQNTFPAEQDAAWLPLNQRLAGTSVDPSGYRAALQRAAVDPALDSLPAIQKSFAQAKIQGWLDALDKDVPAGQNMSWEQAMAVKRRIGDQLGTPEIVASMGNDALKNIYGSLAGDMKTTAAANGQANLFDAANAVTINGHQFIDGTVSKAIQKNNANQETIRPDDAANNLLRDNTAMQQLRDRVPDAADALAAYKLRDMAQAKPGQQGAGPTTSTGTFLTNLRTQQISDPEGTTALFSDPGVSQNVSDLAKVAAQLRATERNANTSGTTASSLLASLPLQLAGAYHLGGLKGAGALLGTEIGLPYLGAKYLTNPGLIKLAAAQQGQRPIAGLLGGAMANLPSQTQPQQGGPIPTITVRPQPQG